MNALRHQEMSCRHRNPETRGDVFEFGAAQSVHFHRDPHPFRKIVQRLAHPQQVRPRRGRAFGRRGFAGGLLGQFMSVFNEMQSFEALPSPSVQGQIAHDPVEIAQRLLEGLAGVCRLEFQPCLLHDVLGRCEIACDIGGEPNQISAVRGVDVEELSGLGQWAPLFRSYRLTPHASLQVAGHY